MAEIILSQAEADMLISLDKVRVDGTTHTFPSPGGSIVLPLISRDRTESFLLDITRGRLDLAKVSYNNRGRTVVGLLRLDVNGAPHRNPDEIEVPCPHLHRYREGYGLKWASPVPPGVFTSLADFPQTLTEFMGLCNVSEPPTVLPTLF